MISGFPTQLVGPSTLFFNPKISARNSTRWLVSIESVSWRWRLISVDMCLVSLSNLNSKFSSRATTVCIFCQSVYTKAPESRARIPITPKHILGQKLRQKLVKASLSLIIFFLEARSNLRYRLVAKITFNTARANLWFPVWEQREM